MTTQRAELDAILAGADDQAVRQALWRFFDRWEPTDALDAEMAAIERRCGAAPWCAAAARWIERACSGEDEPRMRWVNRIIFVVPYAYKIRGKKLTDEHIVNLCASQHLGGVWHFSTMVSTTFGPKTFAALAEPASMRALTELSIPHCKPGKSGVAAIGKSPALSKLAKLQLSQSKLDAKSIEAFAKGGALTALRSLNLASNALGAAGARALAASSMLSKLTELDLGACALDDDAIDALCDRPSFTGLQKLELRANDAVTARAIERIQRAPFASALCELNLSGLAMDLAAARSLSALATLEALDLSYTRLDRDGLAELLGDAALPSLTRLDVSSCRLGPDGARALVAAPVFARLRSLSISDCGLGDEGVLALARASDLGRIEHLSVSGNNCSRESWLALLDAPTLRPTVRATLDTLTQYL